MKREPDFPVRPATIASARRIAALQASVFPDPWGERFVASLMHLPGTLAYVVEGDEALLGYLLARAIGGQAEIISIAVATASQRQGIGAALLSRALAAAALAGAKDMHLEVSPENAAARALYADAGFTESGLRRRYYADGSDALVLRRTLASG